MEDRGKILSIYLRPWVLRWRYRSPFVPHITDLWRVDSFLHRLNRKTPEREPVAPLGFASAWRYYIRGHVVSDHAAKLIRNFLVNCAGRGTKEKNNEDEGDMDKFEDSLHIESSLEMVHTVLARTVQHNDDDEDLAGKATRRRHQRTIQSSKKAWTTCKVHTEDLDTTGHRGFPFLEASLQMIREGKTDADTQRTPYVGRNAPRVKLYANASRRNLNAWLASLTTRQKKPDGTPNKRPNFLQLQYLQRVLDRILLEAAEEEADKINTGTEEPLLDFITGDPGTGKTEILWWLREMFEDQLLWTHGNEFVYLAQQNLMAATIGGNTIHAWGKIPINEEESGRRMEARWEKPDVSANFIACQNLRFLVVDEISLVSAELLCDLESVVTPSIRSQRTYKIRSTGRSTRIFAGVNVLCSGDWWQLPPVMSTPIFSSPFQKKLSSRAEKGLRIFWGSGQDSIRHLCELTEQVRCTDEWHRYFLMKCRHGCQGEEEYNFFHGYPTEHVGSWAPWLSDKEILCGNPACIDVQNNQWPQDRKACKSWLEMKEKECTECKLERKRRCRLKVQEDSFFHEQLFILAPYVHPHNMPKYFALQIRTTEYAKSNGLAVHWIKAQDTALSREDHDLTSQQLRERKLAWLGWHDQKTAGIMGLFPLMKGLPVRCTQTLHRQFQIFKNTRGVIVDWELDEREASSFESGRYERVLSHMPRVIYIRFQHATWTIHPQLGHKVFPLRPGPRVWSRDKKGNAKVRRVGFALVPDFGGTAHSYQGATLNAAIVDCLEMDQTPRALDMLTSYVSLSRVRQADTLLLMQPYAPALFQRGCPPGPHLLMQRLRGILEEHQIKNAFSEMEEAQATRVYHLMKRTWRCHVCQEDKPLMAFIQSHAVEVRHVKERCVESGARRMCHTCNVAARGRAGSKGMELGKRGRLHGKQGHCYGSLGEASGQLGQASGQLGEASGQLGTASGSLGKTSGTSGKALGQLGKAAGHLGKAAGYSGKACGPSGKAAGDLGKAAGSSGGQSGKSG